MTISLEITALCYQYGREQEHIQYLLHRNFAALRKKSAYSQLEYNNQSIAVTMRLFSVMYVNDGIRKYISSNSRTSSTMRPKKYERQCSSQAANKFLPALPFFLLVILSREATPKSDSKNVIHRNIKFHIVALLRICDTQHTIRRNSRHTAEVIQHRQSMRMEWRPKETAG